MNEIRLAKTLYLAEHIGGVFYDRFAAHVDNSDVAGTFAHFAGDEHHHAASYAQWLQARGHAAPSPATTETLVLPTLRVVLAPQSLEAKLRTFAKTEALAARHLTSLSKQIRDPELKSIVDATIPFELEHSLWYEQEGRRMLRPADRR
jgi:rubrerythrin